MLRRSRHPEAPRPPLTPLPACASLPAALRFSAALFRPGARRGSLFLECVVWSAPGLLCVIVRLRDRPCRAFSFSWSGGSGLAAAVWRRGANPRGVWEGTEAGSTSRLRSLASPRPALPPPGPRPASVPAGERGLRGRVARAQHFRFSGEPGSGAVLEIRVPQVRAAPPAAKRALALCGSRLTWSGPRRGWGPQLRSLLLSVRARPKAREALRWSKCLSRTPGDRAREGSSPRIYFLRGQ